MEPRLCYLFFWQGVIAEITITENVTISLLQAAADVFLRWELRWAIYSWIFEVSRYLLLTRTCKITNFHFSFLKAIIVLWFNSWMKVKYHINKSNFFRTELLHAVNLILFLSSNNSNHAYHAACNYKSANSYFRLFSI